MPIDNRPFPRFVADASRHGIPHGRFAERLATAFRAACEEIEDLPEGTEVPEELTWFPERSWSGRVWVPVSGDGEAILDEGGEPEPIELYGFVSFVQPEGGDPTDFRASADFTDVVAADNPDWSIDISDEVIGTWHGEQGREASMTLVWGRSLVRDAFAVTAELDGGPILLQAEVPVLPGDDAGTLAARVLKEEHRIYPEALGLLARRLQAKMST